MLLSAAPLAQPLVPLWAMELLASVFLHAWLFCLGATVGSFLNVVVYRLPRGKNLAYPGSSCPHCGHPIRLADNIPLLSFLVLRGRCRDCRARISPRYFWVELLVASLFLGLAFWERTSFVGAWGDAVRPPLSPHDVWPYWARYATHAALLTTMLGGILIVGDHFSTPPKLFLPAIVLGFVLPIFWPEIRSVPAFGYGQLPPWQAGLIDGLAALTLGILPALVGSLWRLYSHRQWPTFSPIAWTAAFALVLGWQRAWLWLAPALFLYLIAAGCLRAVCPPAPDAEIASEPIGAPPASEENAPAEPCSLAPEKPPPS